MTEPNTPPLPPLNKKSIYLTGAFATSSSLFLEIRLDKLLRTEVVGFNGHGGFLNTESDMKFLNLKEVRCCSKNQEIRTYLW